MPFDNTRMNSLTRAILAFASVLTLSGLISACGGTVVENRTVDLPAREPVTTTTVQKGKWIGSKKITLGDYILNRSFQLTDSRSRVLVVGHVEVLRDGFPVDHAGAFLFGANEFESNYGFFRKFIEGIDTHEAVTFVSGNWFAGHIYAGTRRLRSVRLAAATGDQFPLYSFRGCGSNILRWPEWKSSIDLNDHTKAYYLGHITYNVTPIKAWPGPGGRLDATVRDLSDQYEDELRTLIGDRELAHRMMPSCPE